MPTRLILKAPHLRYGTFPETLSCLKWFPPLKFQSFSLVLLLYHKEVVPFVYKLSSQMEDRLPEGVIRIREGFLYSRQAPGRISLKSSVRSVSMT